VATNGGRIRQLRTNRLDANSAPIGWPAVLFVGVDDVGFPQQGSEKLEDLMKSVSGVLDQAYPAIYRHIAPLHVGDGACLAVVIPGSEARPHFAGKSYVRDGPQTQEASEDQYKLLIAQRQSKAREILQWKGRNVAMTLYAMGNKYGGSVLVADCNQFFVTLEHPRTGSHPFGAHWQIRAWYPLARISHEGSSKKPPTLA
jgi:hypothetical protein